MLLLGSMAAAVVLIESGEYRIREGTSPRSRYSPHAQEIEEDEIRRETRSMRIRRETRRMGIWRETNMVKLG